METLTHPLGDLLAACEKLHSGESFQASARWVRLATLAAGFPENAEKETPSNNPLLETLLQDYSVKSKQNPESGVFTFWKP